MSFVYFNIWQIRLIRPQQFETAMIGFSKDVEKDLLAATSPFVFRGNRRNADVLISAMFKRYYNSGQMGLQVAEGVKFLTNNGEWLVNYPLLHAANLTAKDNNTYQRLKPTIRIFKNMRNRMVEYGLLPDGVAPSYFIEGMVYNVPNDGFRPTRSDTMVASINWLLQADRTAFTCANRQHPLLGENSPTSWKPNDCTTFLDAVVKFWNDWN